MTKFKFMKVTSLAVIAVICLSLTASAQDEQRGQRGQRGGQQRGQRGGGFGQRGGFSFGRGGSRTVTAMSLIRRDEVQKELKISEEQKGTIDDLVARSRVDYGSLFSGGRNLTEEQRAERTKKFAELRAEGEKKSKEAEGYLFAVVLDDPQAKRIKEIMLQQQGLEALLKAETQKALNFTAEQTAKLKAAKETRDKKQTELSEKTRKLFGSLRGNRGENTDRDELRKRFAEMREKGEKLREEGEKNRKTFDTALNSVMSAAQKAKFEELKGKKFDLPSRRRGGQRGRPGGGSRPQRPGGGDRPSRPDRQ